MFKTSLTGRMACENGQYRIPKDNPFFSTPGARKEVWAYGMRNPHRMAWDVESPRQANLLAFVIGANAGNPVRYETIDIIRRGANYGYPLREGPEYRPESPVYGPLSPDETLPLRITDTTVLNDRVPMQDSALAYKTSVEGNAIAGGFVYWGKK
jgi:glucose/arabinose dehydrogenase